MVKSASNPSRLASAAVRRKRSESTASDKPAQALHAQDSAPAGQQSDEVKRLAKSAARAYDHIREHILSGSYRPGEALREHVLAAEIGVSRTPIREALRRLAADGFVSFVANQGASVTEWTERSLADLIDVRSELAAMAARLAAGRIQSTELEALRLLNVRLLEVSRRRASDYLNEAARLNIEFHKIVFSAAANPWLRQLLEQTSYLPMVQRAYFEFDAGAWQHASARYDDLIEALSLGDGEWAASAIRSHFRAARQSIARKMLSSHLGGPSATGAASQPDIAAESEPAQSRTRSPPRPRKP
jgi:DNA-binding GntR family transcriptional regulator